MKEEKIIKAIFSAVDEINQHQAKEAQLEKSVDTVLFDKTGRLDSLEFVSLITAVEQKIQEEFGVAVALADEKAMSQKESPFRSIKTLAEHISLLLEEGRHG